MIDIFEVKPNELDHILYESLDNLNIIEERNTYYYFRDEIFFKQLDQYISKNHKMFKGKLKDLKDLEAVDKVTAHYENNLVRAKYLLDFDKQRQRFFIYNNNLYTYTFNSFGSVTNIITVHQWELEDIAGNLENYAIYRNASFFQILKWKIFKS